MKKILTIFVLLFLIVQIFGIKAFSNLNKFEEKIINFDLGTCENISDSDIPTIFIPGILASWYSQYGFENNKVKRWVPDPITHSYDTLFYTFKQNGYTLKDVYYKNEFETYIDPVKKEESSFYVFGYDWKKDNKITAKLLSDLITDIRLEYEKANGCDIGTVNIVAHSMGGLVARSFLSDICSSDLA